MRDDYTHIVIVLDRSGSMASCEDATREGFNKFITDQQALPGEATVSLVQFDDKYEVDYEFRDIKKVDYLNKENYVPRGSTALLDAIGTTIENVGRQLAGMPEKNRPGRVIFVIQTDGFENASMKFNRDEILKSITHQREKYSWNFVFLGANQDAIASAATIGIASASALSYNSSNNYAFSGALHHYTSGVRCARTLGDSMKMSFCEADRDTSMEDVSVTTSTTVKKTGKSKITTTV